MNGKTVSDLTEAWIASRGYAASSVEQRRSIMKRFARYCPQALDELEPLHIVQWWADVVADLAPASRKAHFGSVSVFLRWARSLGFDTPDLASLIRQPRVPRSAPKTLTAAEQALVRTAPMTLRERLICTLMLDLGLRAGEVSRLRGEDLDHDGGTVTVVGKGGNVDLLPLPDSVAALVPRHTIGRLVPLTPNSVSVEVVDLLHRLGIEGRTGHALRRTFATELVRHGVDLRTVQALLRHQSIATSEHYLALPDLERMRAAVAA